MRYAFSRRLSVCFTLFIAPVVGSAWGQSASASASGAASASASTAVPAGWSTIETEHLRVHVPPSPKVDAAAFAARQERALEEIRGFFPVTLPGRIDYHVWNSGEEAQRELGRRPGFALPKALRIHAVADQTPGHELTHVVVFHAVHPEQSTALIEEGTAVAFDLTGRERLSLARAHLERAGTRSIRVLDLWTAERSDPAFYAIAGAFVERLIARGGRERLLALLKRQTVDAARTIYGADFDRIVADFETDLTMRMPTLQPPPAAPAPVAPGQSTPAQAATENPNWPTIESLRARGQERIVRDRTTLTAEQWQDLERLYQSASRNLKAPDAKDILRQVVQKYPRSNRAGCAVLYLAQLSEGDEKEKYLQEAIKNHADAWFGNGVQVAALSRFQLAGHYARTGRIAEALKLGEEINKDYPGAVDHAGRRLAESIQRFAASQAPR
jgi:TolA-binding protein